MPFSSIDGRMQLQTFVRDSFHLRIISNIIFFCSTAFRNVIFNCGVVRVLQQMAFLSPTTQCLEADKLKMRRWVVTNILDSEQAYLQSTLDILLQVSIVLLSTLYFYW